MKTVCMIESMKNRRSIRKYAVRDIDSQLLEGMLEESFRASTMGNMQLYSVIVTRDAEMKKKLSPAHYNQPMVLSAPVVLTFCADFHRFTQWCMYRNATPGYDNLLSFVNAATDALLVAQSFCNIAENQGLGICYLGTVLYNTQKIIDILGLPELVFPVATVTVGYPDETPKQTDRLPAGSLIHSEVYTDYNRQRIDEIYAGKETLPESLRFIEENNKQNLAQVFTDVRYTKEDNEAISDALLKALSRQGFLKQQ